MLGLFVRAKHAPSPLFIRTISTSADKKPFPVFSKILIANRGEIACRVIRTARKNGVRTVAVYSDADKHSMHTSFADEARLIGPPPAKESYLKGDVIIKVAKETGAQAIHPGYGFLSENADFAEMCDKEGIVFIGPPVSAIRAMGSKSASKDIMINAKVPVIPGYHGENQDMEVLKSEAKKIGYPVLIKAVLGGGGKGMRIVEKEDELEDSVNSSKREAISSFGDDRVLVEKYIRHPRHVEIQVFGDKHGNVVHLFERDCSVQRRHQKVIEEAPAPLMPTELRAKMGQAAVQAAKAVGYVGAGTVEFILDEDGSFYFMEMNTRLQVEHPITEMITGQDLVDWQLNVAAGNPLPLTQDQLKITGHAFEARVYAENPQSNFLPGTGKLVHLSTPTPSENVRVDTGVRQGDEVSVYYDPMIAKLVVWDPLDRDAALRRLHVALDQFHVVGLHTNLQFLRRLSAHPTFQEGKVETGFIPKYHADLIPASNPAPPHFVALATLATLLQDTPTSSPSPYDPHSPWNTPSTFRVNSTATRTIRWIDPDRKDSGEKDSGKKDKRAGEIAVSVVTRADGSYELTFGKHTMRASGKFNGDTLTAYVGDNYYDSVRVVRNDADLNVFHQGQSVTLTRPATVSGKNTDAHAGSLLSPMPGKIVKVAVKVGDKVAKGAPLVIMEAMKMEHTIRAPANGVVESVRYNVGDLVEEKKILVTITAEK